MSRPLPGIRFVAAPAAAGEVLPRMDIAVFAGFAATGPLHIPVAVESVAEFALVFGADAPLARCPQRQQLRHAALAPAVRAFFANGGRRCWVIRVARSAALEALRLQRGAVPAVPDGVARYNRFPLAGVLAAVPQAEGGWALAPALARARCEGSWSDTLQVQASFTTSGFAITGFAPWRFDTTAALAPGDLLRLDDGAGEQAFAAVASFDAARGRATLGPPCRFRQPVSAGQMQRGTATFGELEAVAARLVPAPAGAAQLKLLAGVASLPPEGRWVAFDDGETGQRHWFAIARTVAVQRAASSARLLATFEGQVWQPLAAGAPVPVFNAATVLEGALAAQADGGERVALEGLGLAAAHPRWWNATPTDDIFFADPTVRSGARFPLAGDDSGATLLLPLWLDAPATTALPQAASALERDGLSRFGPELFVDPDLADTGPEAMPDQADAIRYAETAPRRLFGVHAVLGFGDDRIAEEATLLSLPDAAQPGWVPAAFDDEEPQRSPRFARPQWLGEPCADAAATPVKPDRSRFLAADLALVHTPHFFALPVLPPAAGFTLRWTHINPHPDTYMLEQASLADWSDAREIYRGAASSFDLRGRGPGRYFFRVRALRAGETSNWSRGHAVQVRGSDWQLAPPAAEAPALLALQRAVLRLCKAKGDLLVVLSMPSHFREDEALAHALALGTPAAGQGGSAVLSYGALYHPWITESRPEGGMLDVPPDGAAAGVLAARALRRGAWIAPANERLKDVVALTPVIPAEARQALQDAQLNLLRQEARGFVVLNADTLSDEEELRPVNVRRLLMLLRRTALRRSALHVFEPNGAELRRGVQRSFDRLMNELFRRGAFAGDRPESAYRVRIGDDLNTPQSVDAGRLLVELKVAPAVPLSFLTVVLQQVGERLTVAETV